MIEPSSNNFALRAYLAFTHNGLALPLFAATNRPNVWKIANPVVEGNIGTRISSFSEFHPGTEVELLEPNKIIPVMKGDYWLSVFLVNGDPLVGTARNIIENQPGQLKSIANNHPLSMLDLYPQNDGAEHIQRIENVFDQLVEKFEMTIAQSWACYTYFRSNLQLRLRLTANREKWPPEILNSIAEISIDKERQNFNVVAPKVLFGVEYAETLKKCFKSTQRLLNSGCDHRLYRSTLIEKGRQVTCYTPKKEVIILSKGASLLDFAYEVHTEIGHTCRRAIVNGIEKPLRQEVRDGDIVEIIRRKERMVFPGWQKIAKTKKAINALKKLTIELERLEFKTIGHKLADHAFAREGMVLSNVGLEDFAKRYSYLDVDSIFLSLGKGVLSLSDFIEGVFPARIKSEVSKDKKTYDRITDSNLKLYIKGLDLIAGKKIEHGQCCSPIPDDRIVGIDTHKLIAIHTIDCPSLEKWEQEPDKWLDLGWRKSSEYSLSEACIRAKIENLPSALGGVISSIGEFGVNVTNTILEEPGENYSTHLIYLHARNVSHLSEIVFSLRANVYILTAKRARYIDL